MNTLRSFLTILAVSAATITAQSCSGGKHSSNNCYAIDGDTLDCDGTRLRLNGIDAPERGSFDGEASKLFLNYAVEDAIVIWYPYKLDRYNRTVAQVYADGADLSCVLLFASKASYVERWDENLATKACAGGL